MSDWISDELAGKPCGWIDEQVRFHIDDLRRGGTAAHEAHADFLARYVSGHRPPQTAGTEVADGPCSACGEPWPCGAIRSAFAPG